jgi:hypothetical protein
MMLPLNQAGTPLLITGVGRRRQYASMIGRDSGALFRIAQFAK